MSNLIFSKGSFIIFRAGNGIIVYNKDKVFEEGHSHLKSLKSAKDAIFFAMSKKIPKDSRDYYLITLQRISTDTKYISDIQSLMDTRHHKGKQNYRNDTGKKGLQR